MKPLLFLFCLCFFAACSSSEQTTELTLPRLLIQHPLPAFPDRILTSQLKIDLEIQVAEDGSVRNARLARSSGNLMWDSLAIERIRQWRYSPALHKGQPVRLWLRQPAVVQFVNPTNLYLAEIVSLTMDNADSAYRLLTQGADFTEVVLRYSVGASREKNGIIGEVNIQLYADNVQHLLADLGIENFSKPVQYGDRYVIFKRMKK
ncbi:MAG: energy transducer TonB [Bacteroidota bacterium]|nr:energy transducer TonB [Bacteroidota bacterium]